MTQPIPPEILALTNVDPNDVLEDMAAEVGRLTKMLKASHRAMTQLVDRLADVQRQLEAANATVRELESELAAPARADETTGDETQPEVQP
jgi:septal ring factor EnvC (AmiA/AmiB activator)